MWHTWQLVVVALGAAVVGMVIGNSGGGSAAPTNKPTYTVPPPSGSSQSTVAGTSSTTSASTAGASSTTVGSATTTTVGSSSTTATTGPARVLLGPKQSSGNWTSTAFTTTGSWDLGWAYQCTPAPASGPAFQVFAFPVGSSPGSTPVVTQTGASGNSVTPVNTTGNQEIQVTASSSCEWVVKVTGS